MAQSAKSADSRSAAQIRADLAAARARMSANVETLVTEVHPTTQKERAVDSAKSLAAAEVANAKSQIKDEAGWRVDRLVVGGGALAGVLSLLAMVRAIVKRVRRR